MQLRRLATQSMLPRLPQRRLMNNLPIATKSVTRKYPIATSCFQFLIIVLAL